MNTRRIYLFTVAVTIACTLYSIAGRSQMSICDDFEGGNIELRDMDNEKNYLHVRPGLTGNNNNRIWFYFMVSGYRSDTALTILIDYHAFDVPDIPRTVSILNDYIVYSCDDSEFSQVKGERYDQNTKKYVFDPIADTCYVALGYPYLYSDLQTYQRIVAQHPSCSIQDEILSEKGHVVPVVCITDAAQQNPGKPMMWIFGRQHAFEAPANFFLEGMIAESLADTPEAIQFRQNYALYFVPMVDVDNVISGGTGKGQHPIDFNRDWADEGHWKAVIDIKKMVSEKVKENPLIAFIDCHTPFPVEPLGHYYVTHQSGTVANTTVNELYARYTAKTGFAVYAKREDVEGNAAKAAGYFQKEYGKGHSGGRLLFSLTNEINWHPIPTGGLYTPEELRRFGKAYMESLIETML